MLNSIQLDGEKKKCYVRATCSMLWKQTVVDTISTWLRRQINSLWFIREPWEITQKINQSLSIWDKSIQLHDSKHRSEKLYYFKIQKKKKKWEMKNSNRKQNRTHDQWNENKNCSQRECGACSIELLLFIIINRYECEVNKNITQLTATHTIFRHRRHCRAHHSITRTRWVQIICSQQ